VLYKIAHLTARMCSFCILRSIERRAGFACTKVLEVDELMHGIHTEFYANELCKDGSDFFLIAIKSGSCTVVSVSDLSRGMKS
jgi:hypothetical protein